MFYKTSPEQKPRPMCLKSPKFYAESSIISMKDQLLVGSMTKLDLFNINIIVIKIVLPNSGDDINILKLLTTRIPILRAETMIAYNSQICILI